MLRIWIKDTFCFLHLLRNCRDILEVKKIQQEADVFTPSDQLSLKTRKSILKQRILASPPATQQPLQLEIKMPTPSLRLGWPALISSCSGWLVQLCGRQQNPLLYSELAGGPVSLGWYWHCNLALYHLRPSLLVHPAWFALRSFAALAADIGTKKIVCFPSVQLTIIQCGVAKFTLLCIFA